MPTVKSFLPLLVAACAAAQAQQPPATATATPPAAAAESRAISRADRQFMVRAAAWGHAEVAAGRLARSQSTDADVREYGRMLVDDHQEADRALARIARRHGVALPTRPTARLQRQLQQLTRVRPQAFDAAFLLQAVDDHQQAIALFQDEAQRQAAAPAVRAYARQVLPTLHKHLERAQALQARMQAAAGTAAVAVAPGVRAGTEHVQELLDARQKVQESVQVVQRMKSDPQLARLLERAWGVFIVPNYGRGALGIGAQGGEGLLVTRQGRSFGSPAFYNMGGLSIGAQAGAASGEVAFLLMTERAVQQFRSDRNFSLTADAGLTIGNYSERGQASSGKVEDVVVWSDTEGAYAGVSVGVTDVVADNEANRAYYNRPDATPLTILSGRLEDPYGNALGRVLGA